MPAGAPVGAAGGSPVGGGDLPGIVLAEQDAAGIEADGLDEGLAGAVEEVGGADSALEDAEGAGHAFQENAHLGWLEQGNGARAERQVAGRGRTARWFIETVDAVRIAGAGGRDADGAT